MGRTPADRAAERIEDAAIERDWHSDYAVFILRLADRLQATADPAEREQIIARLEEAGFTVRLGRLALFNGVRLVDEESDPESSIS